MTAQAQLPETMRSLVAPWACKPAEYEVMDMPVPQMKTAKDVLIRVHASVIITGDTMVASGRMRLLAGKTKYPAKLGIMCSGEVITTGSEVTAFKPGDSVYGAAFGRPMDYRETHGFCSEYCVSKEPLLILKPPHMPHEDTVALGPFVITAIQSFDLAVQRLREQGVPDGLEGKTVFVPGALSATGSLGIQLLRNVYSIGKIIATVSTAKMGLIDEYLGKGMVDQLIDYQKTPDLTTAVRPGSVDFAYNTQFATLGQLTPLMNRETGVIVSIASVPPSSLIKEVLPGLTPFWVLWIMDLVNWYYRWRLRGTKVTLDFVSGHAGVREDMEKAGELIALGKAKAVMRIVKLDDIDAVRKACQEVYTGRGGVGKLVIKII